MSGMRRPAPLEQPSLRGRPNPAGSVRARGSPVTTRTTRKGSGEALSARGEPRPASVPSLLPCAGEAVPVNGPAPSALRPRYLCAGSPVTVGPRATVAR